MAGRLQRWFGGGRWKVFALWGGVLALVGGSLIYGSIVYTSRPKFCFECHLMEPYYNSWEAGSHKNVECMACHAEPGVLGTMEAKVGGLKQLLSYSIGSYRGKLPQGYVSDENCTACHDRGGLMGKRLDFEGMTFDHGQHLDVAQRGLTLKCTTCHTQVDEKAHMTVDVATCFTCHLRTDFSEEAKGEALVLSSPIEATASRGRGGISGIGGDCLLCHRAPLLADPALAATHAPVMERNIDCARCHGSMNVGANAEVTTDRCRKCHFESRVLERREDTVFMHQAHATNVKIECIDCHSAPIHVSEGAREHAAQRCDACHEDMHGAQQRMFLAAEHEVPASVTLPPFHAGLQCQSCHLDLQPVNGNPALGSARVTTADSCRTCHAGAKEGDFGRLLEKWKSGGEQARAAVLAHIGAVETAVNGTSEEVRARAKPMLDAARAELVLVESARPVHNIHLARVLFAEAGRMADGAARDAGVADAVPPFRNPAAIAAPECARCHLAVAEGIPAGKRAFSHGKHMNVEGMTCARCHNEEPRHGNLWVNDQACSDCHHQEQRDRCATCHPMQASLYDGRWDPGATDRKNLMATEVHCVECHFPDEGRTTLVRPTSEDCRKCHDRDVGSLLEDWKSTVARAVATLEAQVVAAEKEDALLSVEQRRAVQEARSVLEFVKKDGSGGIHNPFAVEQALSRRTETLKKILGK